MKVQWKEEKAVNEAYKFFENLGFQMSKNSVGLYTDVTAVTGINSRVFTVHVGKLEQWVEDYPLPYVNVPCEKYLPHSPIFPVLYMIWNHNYTQFVTVEENLLDGSARNKEEEGSDEFVFSVFKQEARFTKLDK